MVMCTLRGHEGAYPTPFEAVLRTERAFFSKLQTCWTLQGTGVVRTFQAYALLRLSRSCRHSEGQSGRRLL